MTATATVPAAEAFPTEAAVAAMIETLRAGGRQPTFFIVGAQKSGTTGLSATLATHPDVFMPAIKEPNFFCTDIDPKRFSGPFRLLNLQGEEQMLRKAETHELRYAYIRRPENYARLFAGATGRAARGEGSISYLFSAAAPALIARTVPDARIVVLLRDPVARAFSAFKMERRAALEDHADFVAAVHADAALATSRWGEKHLYVEVGRYAPQLERYFAHFPREQVLVLLHDDFVARPQEVLSRLLAHIGLDPDPTRLTVKRENVARMPRFEALNRFLFRTGLKRQIFRVLPRGIAEHAAGLYHRKTDDRLDPKARAELLPYFAEDIGRLEALLGVDLAAWRREAA